MMSNVKIQALLFLIINSFQTHIVYSVI